MRVGVVMWPIEAWPEMGQRWQEAEKLGFHTAWMFDHIAWRGHVPWDEAYSTLAAAAALTRTIRLGTLVTSPNFRHPVPTAAAIKTIDRISTGRLSIGIGAGAAAHLSDGDILDRDWTTQERAARYDEFVDQLDALLTSSPATVRGAFWSARDVTVAPGLVQQRPPFYLAGAGRRAISLAVKHGQGWITNARDPDRPGLPQVRDQLDRLDRECDRVGRDPTTIDRLVLAEQSADRWLDSLDAFEDLHGQYEQAGFTDVVISWPRPGTQWDADPDVFEAVAAFAARKNR